MKPTATMLSRESVTLIAEKVAKELGYTLGDDIMPIVSKLGGEVLYRNFWAVSQKHAQALLVRDHADFTIWAPSTVMPARLRFEIAHALGHYVLHFLWNRQAGKPVQTPLFVSHYAEEEDGARIDYEANWFAMSFIAPKDRFTGAWRRHNGDFYAIEKETGLSGYFINLRAQGLGLLPQQKVAA